MQLQYFQFFLNSSQFFFFLNSLAETETKYQLFASEGAINFPIKPETEAWKEKVCNCYQYVINEKFHINKSYMYTYKPLHLFYLQIKRLYLLLTTKESAMDVPSNLEARRRMSFFSNSLFMDMPLAPKVRNMLSFS